MLSANGCLKVESTLLLPKRGIKIIHQNTRGLFTNMAYIAEIFESFRGIDTSSLSEIHIDQKHDKMPHGCTIYRDIHSLDVAVYIFESLRWDRREDLEMEEVEVIWLGVMPKKSHGFLVALF